MFSPSLRILTLQITTTALVIAVVVVAPTSMDQHIIIAHDREEDMAMMMMAADNDNNRRPPTRYALQFPGMLAPIVMYIDDMFMDEFFDNIHSANIPPPPPVPPQKIPAAMLVECTPQQGDTCAICLNDATTTPHPSEPVWVTLLRCNHRFHRECVRQCHGVNCPMCRTPQQ
jgi:hypothetical protein